MEKNIKYSISLGVFALSLFLGLVAYAQEDKSEDENDSNPVACTMDAKVCPDGSSVGRVGPKCEFAKCPGDILDIDSDTKINIGSGFGRGEVQLKINDNDKDGIKDSIDTDDDNDGILDVNDKKPLDNDNDGQNDKIDLDDDNDGQNDDVDNDDDNNGVVDANSLKTDIKERRIQLKTEAEGVKDEIKNLKEENKIRLEAMLKSVKSNREAFKVEFETKKEEAKVKMEEMKTRFKEGLKVIKDEDKKISAEKIVEIIAELNARLTVDLSVKVDKIENVLVGIESRINKAESKGIDVTTVKAEVVKAKTAISTARTAISTQTSKVYTVNITSESTLKAEMKKIRDAFSSDVKVVRETVKQAHEAVRITATTLAQIPKIDEDLEVDSEVEVNNNTNNN